MHSETSPGGPFSCVSGVPRSQFITWWVSKYNLNKKKKTQDLRFQYILYIYLLYPIIIYYSSLHFSTLGMMSSCSAMVGLEPPSTFGGERVHSKAPSKRTETPMGFFTSNSEPSVQQGTAEKLLLAGGRAASIVLDVSCM